MKKLLSFALSGLIFSTVFFACTKEEEKVDAPDTLVGTAWLYEVPGEEGDEAAAAIELDFISATKVDVNAIGATEEVILGFELGTCSYTYKKPNVTIDFDGEKVSGSINGKKLTLDDAVFVLEDEELLLD